MKKRITSAALVLSALLVSFASCGGAEEQAPVSSTAADTAPVIAETEADTAELDAYELRQRIPDGLGEYDFEGFEYRVITSEDRGRFVEVEAETGDTVDDAVYHRNRAVEERFNCKIVSLMDSSNGDTGSFVRRSVSANEDAFDLMCSHVVTLGTTISGGYYMNWYDLPIVDFSKPWWSDCTVDNLTYHNKCYIAIGDFALSAMSTAYCVFYNRRLGSNYDLPDMFEVVRDGKFTIDYLIELTKDIYSDLDHDGKKSDTDLYGMTSSAYSNLNAYLWAFDNPIYTKNGDGFDFTYKTEKIGEIIAKIKEMFSAYDGIHTNKFYVDSSGTNQNYSINMFANGTSVFANGFIQFALTHLRELEDDYSILPYPKWNEEQDAYHTMSDGNHGAMAIPKTLSDLERSGVLTEALCAESYKILYPAYYDVALKVKGTRDEESMEMLDIIVNGRMFDFGYVYDGWKGCSFIIETVATSSTLDFEAFWAKRQKSIFKYYDRIFEAFDELD